LSFFDRSLERNTIEHLFWLRPKVFDAFDGWGCFGETQAQGDWMASWGDLCPLGPTKTFVNTHWIAFWGVFYRLENNKTFVNGEWNAVGVSHCKCDFSSAHYFVCV
jgi:hypothetical protein